MAKVTSRCELMDNTFAAGPAREDQWQRPIRSIAKFEVGQKLFVLDEASGMKMLEQSVQSGIWQQPVEIMIPDSDEMIEFTSYTLRIQLDDKPGMPMTDQAIKLCSTTSAEMLVNDTSVRGSPDG